MSDSRQQNEPKQGISKVKLAIGAASLFLFIVGIKRTFKVEEEAARPEAGAGSRARPDA